MPHIGTDKVAIMRQNIRRALPAYKINVRTHHGSTVDVRIMSGPIAPVNVNVYWYKEHLKNNAEALALIETILSKIHEVQTPRELVYDGDYGSVPTFYISVNFGEWNKPYQQI